MYVCENMSEKEHVCVREREKKRKMIKYVSVCCFTLVMHMYSTCYVY